MEFKDMLKKLMDEKNLKSCELVEKTGICKSAISQYLSGKYKPKLENLILVSNALDVDITYFLETGKGEKK